MRAPAFDGGSFRLTLSGVSSGRHVAVLGALWLVACGSAANEAEGPAPAAPSIRPGPPGVVRQRVVEALADEGSVCQVRQQAVVCDADNPKRATLIVVYAVDPPRLALVLPFRLQSECVAAMPSLNAFNRDYDFVTLTCDDDGALRATGVVMLPHDGMPPAEVARYTAWWRDTTVATLRATHIAELLH